MLWLAGLLGIEDGRLLVIRDDRQIIIMTWLGKLLNLTLAAR